VDDELSDEEEDDDEVVLDDVVLDDVDGVVVADGVLVALTCAVVVDELSAGSLPAAIWM
jgi:hypothetical protein